MNATDAALLGFLTGATFILLGGWLIWRWIKRHNGL